MAWMFALIGFGLAAFAAWHWLRLREKLHRLTLKRVAGAIPTIRLEDLDPAFALTPHGPSRATEIAHIAGYGVMGGVSDLESWILCVLAKRAKRALEIGTATGKTAYLLACNLQPGGELVTLTLPPDAIGAVRHEAGDDQLHIQVAKQESSFTDFLYSGSDVEKQIKQLFADSKSFDWSPYAGAFDLIFIDGDHTRSYVLADTENALKMLAPGGWLLWHDYRGAHVTPGVHAALNELHPRLGLRHIRNTSLVAYQAPAA